MKTRVKIEKFLRLAAAALLPAISLLALSACGGSESAQNITLSDTIAPVTTALPGGGAYSTVQYITLASDETATIYYSLDGADPAKDAPNTVSGSSPVFWVRIGNGTTVLKYFAIDSRGNQEPVKTEMYLVTVPSSPFPVANAGPDQTVLTGATVTLDGSGSSTANGVYPSYLWSFISMPPGSAATLSIPTAIHPKFIPDREGLYVVSLVVSDGQADSTADTVMISAVNAAPVANAGPNRAVPRKALVTLDGSGSTDANGDALIYNWSFISIPAGSNAMLSNPTAMNPTFFADIDGLYIVSLVVNDGHVDSAAVMVTLQAMNFAPVADAGPDRNVATGLLVSLNGSGSSDANGDALTYNWSFTSVPAGSVAALSDPAAVNPSFTVDMNGTYVLSLVVNDGTVSSAPAVVRVIAPIATSRAVPDTGQTVSFTNTFGEDNDYSINPPSYMDNGDGTITDNITGLLWQKQGDGATRTWDAAIAYCSNLSLVGGGWRLPDAFELLALVDYGRYSPAINLTYFPGIVSSYYWSSTPYFGNNALAYSIDFSMGREVVYYKTNSLHTLCVRGEEILPVFLDNRDGTVTDKVTNLMWQKQDSVSTKTWEQSLSYCEGLALGGFTDWRLPNVKELASIVDYGRYAPAINTTYFPGTAYFYWSSTTLLTLSDNAIIMNYSSSYFGDYTFKSYTCYVRCVRGGQ